MNIFRGMKILWIFLGGHHKIGLQRSFLCILGSFLNVKVQNGGYFFYFFLFFFFGGGGGGVAKISNIFWRCLKFLIFYYFFLCVNGRCWARASV